MWLCEGGGKIWNFFIFSLYSYFPLQAAAVITLIMWRPIFIIALYEYVVVLRRKFNCVKIPQSEANKIRESPKVELYPLYVVFNLPSLCEHQIQLFTQLRCLLLHLHNNFFN
jgi:hypothetical protein